jgi:hypothetical protein
MNKKSFQDIFKEFDHYSYHNFKLFDLIDKLNFTNKIGFDYIEHLESQANSLRQDSFRSRNLSYSMANLAKVMSVYSTIGKLNGKDLFNLIDIDLIDNHMIFSFKSIRERRKSKLATITSLYNVV